MNRGHDHLGTIVRSALSRQAAEIDARSVDLWPRIAGAIASAGAPERRGLTLRWSSRSLAACVLAALVLGTGAGVVAASPTLQRMAGAVWSAAHLGGEGAEMNRNGVPIALAPVPKLIVFYPAWVPRDLRISALAQYHPPFAAGDEMGGVSCPGGRSGCDLSKSSVWTTALLSQSGTSMQPTVLSPLVRRTTVVWFGRVALPPSTRFFQLAEWNASRYPISRYPLRSIPRLHAGTPEHRFLLVKRGTGIVVDSNLPMPTLSRIMRSLHRLEGSRHP